MPLLSMRQYADSRKKRGLPGGSAMAVSKAVKAGRIKLIGDKIDSEAADAAWARNTRVNESNTPAGTVGALDPRPKESQGRIPAGAEDRGDEPTPGTMAAAQLAHERAKARKAEFEVRKIEGKLLDAEEVEKAWSRHVDAVKNRLLLLESKVPPECRALVAREVRSALRELSEYSDAA